MAYRRAPDPEIRRQEKAASLARDSIVLFTTSGTVAAGLCALHGLSVLLAASAGITFGFFVTLLSIVADEDGA